jgi:hypothetical protein
VTSLPDSEASELVWSAPDVHVRPHDVRAIVARAAGNVWTNPELTCQHVDPQTPLAPGQRATLEVKILIVRGSLDDAHRRAIQQRGSLH